MLPVDGGELASARVLAIGMCQGIPQAAVAWSPRCMNSRHSKVTNITMTARRAIGSYFNAREIICPVRLADNEVFPARASRANVM
jgi:hypothetical protein